jgi:mannose-6-phosphate isomerase-like protein (cupin superfamily)
MYKGSVRILALLLASSASAQLPRGTATDVSAEEIRATLKKTEATPVSDQSIRMVDVGAYDVGIGVVHRTGPNQTAIEHSKITEVYHVIEGAGTLVTGGTIADAKPSAPESQVVRVLNGPSTAGPSIQGGGSRRIQAGDVVIIPPNTPHWFTNIEGTIVYLVVRVDPEKVVQVK